MASELSLYFLIPDVNKIQYGKCILGMANKNSMRVLTYSFCLLQTVRGQMGVMGVKRGEESNPESMNTIVSDSFTAGVNYRLQGDFGGFLQETWHH